MLLNYVDLLFRAPLEFLRILPGLLLTTAVALATAITIHEFSHAVTALWLGDPTARSQGRVSLNPRAHLDPTGTVMLLLVGFGWGKPTPVNAANFRRPLQGMTLVSLAGPLSNLALALALALPLRFGWLSQPSGLIAAPDLFSGDWSTILGSILLFTFYINVVLAVFNLLPVAPLDGFKVVLGVLPEQARRPFARLETYGPFILMGVILLDWGFNTGILSRLIFPPIRFFVTLMLGYS